MGHPTVSVILPTYNRADVLGRSIESVLAQTYANLELIVIDDGSTDETDSVLSRFNDSRLIPVRHDRNMGVMRARNTGIEMARGIFVAYQDSDDVWVPHKLEAQMNIFRAEDDVGVVGCGRFHHTARATTVVLPTVEGWIFEDLLAGRATGLGTPMLVARTRDERFFFDESFPALAERDYLLQFARKFAIGFVREPLVHVYRCGGPHVANPANAEKAYERYLAKYAEEFKARPKVRAYYHACAAKEASSLGRSQASRGHLVRAVYAHPPGISYYPALLASCFGSRAVRAAFRVWRVRPPRG